MKTVDTELLTLGGRIFLFEHDKINFDYQVSELVDGNKLHLLESGTTSSLDEWAIRSNYIEQEITQALEMLEAA